MGVGGLLNISSLLPNGLAKLTDTKREYFLQSLTLVYACRQLPDPPRVTQAGDQQGDFETLIKKIEKALRSGTNASSGEAPRAFKDADRELQKYLVKYDVRFKPLNIQGQVIQTGAMKEAAQRDKEAQEQMERLEGLVKKKWAELEKIPKVQVPLNFWFDKPISLDKKKKDKILGLEFKYNNILLINQIKIEESATLDILLHRFLEYTALTRTIWGSVSLIQYPQFYRIFPSSAQEFKSGAGSGEARIPSLDPWKTIKDSVREGIILQLIIERKPGDSRTLTLWDGSLIDIPDDYKNAWPLSDSQDTIVVRRRTPSFSLWLWQPPRNGQLTASEKPLGSSEASKGGSRLPEVFQQSQKHVSNSNRILIEKQVPLASEEASKDGTVASEVYQSLLPHGTDSRQTILIETQKPIEPAEASKRNPSKAEVYRPSLEYASSSGQTLVGKTPPAEPNNQRRSEHGTYLPTFSGEIIQSTTSIGMGTVLKQRKKQGWISWAKSKMGLE